jgi:fengycin family lipopeptide synthetase D
VARLLRQGIEIAPQQMFEYQVIATLVEALTSAAQAAPRADYAHAPEPLIEPGEATVDGAGTPGELPVIQENDIIQPQHVLLTGATGFLGIYLLRELLTQTSASIYCLMRQHKREEAWKRLAGQLQWYFPDEDLAEQVYARVVPVPGDLAEPGCGIAPETYQMLAETVDLIYHLGADVRQIGHYHHFIAVNVGGTQEMLRLTQMGKEKTLHYASTMSVAGVPTDPTRTVFREQDLEIGQKFVNPYVESKFLAERAVRAAIRQGCRANIYRTSHIAADTRTGRFQRNISENGIYRGMRANINMGVAAYLPDMMLDFVPVDFVAQAITRFSLLPEQVQGQTFHLQNPQQFSHYDLIRTLQAIGYPIVLLTPEEYATKLLTLSDDEQYLAELASVIELVGKVEMENVEAIPLRADATLTRFWLKQIDVPCPLLTPSWIRLVIQHCIDVGYLKAPAYWDAAVSTPALF